MYQKVHCTTIAPIPLLPLLSQCAVLQVRYRVTTTRTALYKPSISPCHRSGDDSSTTFQAVSYLLKLYRAFVVEVEALVPLACAISTLSLHKVHQGFVAVKSHVITTDKLSFVKTELIQDRAGPVWIDVFVAIGSLRHTSCHV